MQAAEVPAELIEILDRHAGRAHSRTGSVVTALAEILTRYREMVEAEILTRYREMVEAEHDRGPGREGTDPNPAGPVDELAGGLGA